MSRIAKTNPKAQMVLGLLVVVIGLLFLVDNLGWIDLDFRRLLVPTALLVAGVLKLTQTRTNSGNVVGVVLVCVGAIGILRGIGFLDFDWRDIWPVVLIIVGIGIVYKASNAANGSSGSQGGSGGDWDRSDGDWGRSGGEWDRSGGEWDRSDGDWDRSDGDWGRSDAAKAAFQAPGDDYLKAPHSAGGDQVINFVSLVGSANRRVSTQHFRGGEVTAILGSADLDLRQASIAGDAVLNIFSLAGGITIKVPVDWVVVMEGTAIIGGFEEKTAPPTGSGKRLIVRGYAILGGLEVRN